MPASLTFHLLGGAAIYKGDEALPEFRSRTAEALLIYLACHDRPISRQYLADFLWDDRTEKQAAANLRTILSMLRKEIGDYLISTRRTLAFDYTKAHQVDSTLFESQIRALEPLLNNASTLDAETQQQLQTTLDLYRGEFLNGFHLSESRNFEEWVFLTRERLRRLAVLGLRRLVACYLTNGRYQQGLIYAGRLIAADPYHEEAQRQQMWLLVRSGQPNAALQSYRAFQELLADELGVEPSPSTTTVYERIKSLALPPPCQLPVQATPFIGREEEIESLQQFLTQQKARLISIVGPGGAGKTRLSIQAAQKIADHQPGLFLHGIWFIPLSAVLSPRFLMTAIAKALDLTLKGATAPSEQLLTYLQNRELLLILDNFEHLLAGEAKGIEFLDEILNRAPQVKILVTTRESLHLHEEQIFDIEGLAYPEETVRPVQPATAYSAVQLFLAGAQRVSRRFEPTEQEMELILQLCRLLEGMPLGLEMAAAWVRQHSLEQILSQLRTDLELLESSWHNVPRRHRSLRAVFDHSWSLLTEKEQAAFARLSVFRDGFTEAAALAVTEGAALSPFLAKSLLRKAGPDRFDMHGLVGQYAAGKLENDPPVYQAAQVAHGRYYLNLLHQQKEQLTGGREVESLQLIGQEIENVRRAWQWAVREKASELLDQAHFSLYLFYSTRGWFEEGKQLFGAAAALLEPPPVPARPLDTPENLTYGRLLSRQSWFTYQLGQFSKAQTLARQAEAIFRRLEAENELGQTLNDLGVLARRTGEYEQAKQYYQEALAIRQAVGDRLGMAATLNNLSNIVRLLGDYERAKEYLLECLKLLDEEKNLIQSANAYNDLGEISRALGNYEEARNYYEKSLTIRRKINAQPGMAACLNNLGSVAHAQGDFTMARQYAQESLALSAETNNRRAMTYPLSVLGRIARDEADLALSFSLFKRALKICQEIAYLPKALDIIFELSTVLEQMRKPEQAVRFLAFVIHHPNINQETASAARELLEKIASTLPARTADEFQERGRNDTLNELVDTILKRPGDYTR